MISVRSVPTASLVATASTPTSACATSSSAPERRRGRPGCRVRVAPGRPAGPARGFTLIEILVVVVIIAVLTTVAMLSIGTLGQDQGLDEEGDRYTDVVAAVTEQAQLEGRDFGVYFGPSSYE